MIAIRRKFLTDTVFYGAAQSILGLRELIILPIFARFIGIEGYGIFVQILVIITLLTPLAVFRLDVANVRFLSAETDPVRFRKSFYSGLIWSLGVGIIIGLFLIVFAQTSAQFILGEVIYADLMLSCSLLLTASVVNDFLQNYFRIVHKISLLSGIILLRATLEILFILLAIWGGYGLVGAIWALISVRFTFALALLIWIGRSIGGVDFDWTELRKMLAYGIPLMPNGIGQWVINYADRLIIIQFIGIAAVGLYSAAYALGMALNLLISPVGFVLFPLVSRLWDEGNREETKKYFVFITRYFILLAVPACLLLTFLSQPLMQLMTNSEFTTEISLVFWISLGMILRGLFQINMYAFHLVKKTTYITLILAISTVVNIGLNILLVPVMGLSGAAIATAVTFLGMALIAVFYGRSLIGYHLNWLDIGKTILASLGMAICLLWMPAYNLITIIGAMVVAGIVYIVLLMLMRTFSKSETAHIIQLFTSFWPARSPS